MSVEMMDRLARSRAWDAETKRRGQRVRRRLHVIAERDDYTCGICHNEVDMQAPWRVDGSRSPNPEYPTLDHVTPMASGGGDDDDNLQLAHWGCNARKGGR